MISKEKKIDSISISPQIASLPNSNNARLIDNGMLLYEASVAGLAERYTRGESSHTVHVWWARRPHSAMRALTFGCLSKEVSKQAYELLKQISGSATISNDIFLEQSRESLKSQYDSNPKLLDMFGGGGTIPFEASNLGADAYSIDSNELSVFIQKCNLVYSQEIQKHKIDISKLINESGTRVLNDLTDSTKALFPLRSKNIFGYFWTYSHKCFECGYQFYLSKRPWLSKKKNRSISIQIINDIENQVAQINHTADENKNSVWQGRTSTVKCPKCDAIQKKINVKNCIDELIALGRLGERKGKEFVPVEDNAIPDIDAIKALESELLSSMKIQLPSSKLPLWSGIVNPAIYGIETHSDFVNARQRIVLLCLVKSLRQEFALLCSQHSLPVSKYVISMLSSLIDQLVDWNCRLSMWISQNEQVGRAFSGPGIPMLWDYVETDPLLNGPANLWSKLNRIVEGSRSLNHLPSAVNVQQASAQSLPFDDCFFDAIVTDPPYYDNIYYTVLADFFYSWKRLLLEVVEPSLFIRSETDKSKELVASSHRSVSTDKAHEDYCVQFSLAIKEAARTLKNDGVFSLVYSHSSLNGWEVIVRAYRESNLIITSVQPLSIERKHRPRAMTSEAINTCITFVAHKSIVPKPIAAIEEIHNDLRIIATGFVDSLSTAGWNSEDIALAVFANGVGLLANKSAISDEESSFQSLRTIESVVKEWFPQFNLKGRKSL